MQPGASLPGGIMIVTARHLADPTGTLPTPPGLVALARLAAHVCGADYAVVELLDGDQARPAATHGVEPSGPGMSAFAALVTGDGEELGRLAVYSTDPGELDPARRELLRDLAD